MTNQDYLVVQEALKTINLEPLLRELYPSSGGYAEFNDFLNRIMRGARQTLIDEKNHRFPEKDLIKINEGGPFCIVTCVPLREPYLTLTESIPEVLKASRFNGHFLCLKGGFPNPTGNEMQFVAVPYSFKVFAMLEAYKLGFMQILWIDAAMLPIRDPTPLFFEMEAFGGVFLGWPSPSYAWQYILPATRKILFDLEKVDVLQSFYICTRLFGLDFSQDLAWRFLLDYEFLAALGTPFLSCYPEEFVFTAILGKNEFAPWKRHSYAELFYSSYDPVDWHKIHETGPFFYQRDH